MQTPPTSVPVSSITPGYGFLYQGVYWIAGSLLNGSGFSPVAGTSYAMRFDTGDIVAISSGTLVQPAGLRVDLGS